MYTIEQIAQACHQANKTWCEKHGDHSQHDWDDAPEWANWLTYDVDGWWWHDNKPKEITNNYLPYDFKSKCDYCAYQPACSDKMAIYSRPESHKEVSE